MSVREVGRLALYSLLTAAISRQRNGREPRQSYLVIDEFQRIAGEGFKVILEQARSFGVGVVLSNQSMADLRTKEADLRPTVRTNTRVKMHFSVTDPMEAQALSTLSGRDIFEVPSWSERRNYGDWFPKAVGSITTTMIRPRLSVEDIQRISDHPKQAILHVSRGSGWTQFSGLPVSVELSYSMNQEEYEKLSGRAWEDTIERTFRYPWLLNEMPANDVERTIEEEEEAPLWPERNEILIGLFERYAS